MNPLAGILFLVAVAAVIVVSGYWLNAFDLEDSFAGRLALGALAGLATLLLAAVSVGCFRPLAGAWLGVGLLPAAGSVLWPRARRQLLADVRSLFAARSGRMVLGLGGIFLGLLLLPALRDWQVLFYDGTTNHDSYISITAGEHLQRHTFLEVPAFSATQPWMNMADDNVGWKPRRAQLGAEVLLALFSGLAGTAPLYTCLYFSAALFLPWCAAVYLACVTFFQARFSRPVLAALVLLQPIFIFFHANSNIPNLLGAMVGATVVIATAQALRATARRAMLGWCALLVLGFHGLIAVYPEMVPFTVLPCGLLWLVPWLARRWAVVRANGTAVAGAFLVGAAIDPVVVIRAWHGFRHSFATARADVIFANLFEPLNAAEHVPAFATLAVPAAELLGWVPGGLLTLLLIVGATLGWRRARDRAGVLCTLAGSGALLAYTLATGFNYGWQKSVQFGAVFVAAAFSAPLLDALVAGWRQPGWRRRAAGFTLAGILAFYAAATALNFNYIWDWSRQKVLSRDWLALRELSATTLREQPVLVESASFRLPFFHSMWSSYFLSSSHSYFARRGGEGGGYVRMDVRDESAVPGGRPAALLVGRRWAECFDANSPRLLEGREFVLLREANRVTDLQGVFPTNGYPDNAATRFAMEITPHTAARLRLVLVPNRKNTWPDAAWRVVNRTVSGQETAHEVSGPPPWQLDVALAPGVKQTVECQLLSKPHTFEEWPFHVRQLIVESNP
jgi:hypothetical protein